jgi:hypothetical protein
MSDEPRAWTADELRDKFLGHLSALVRHTLHDKRTPGVREKMNLLVFSILNIFDGTSMGITYDLVAGAHPDDEAFHRAEGENWVPIGVNIADGSLHVQWSRKYEVKS